VRTWLDYLAVIFLGFVVGSTFSHDLFRACLFGFLLCVLWRLILARQDQRAAGEKASTAEHKEWVYDMLIRVGSNALQSLESSMQQASFPNQSQEHMTQIMHFVNRDTRGCREWMMNSTIEVEAVAGKKGRTLFNSQTVIRQSPNFLSNGIDSQVWLQTAARLDWLRVELDKL